MIHFFKYKYKEKEHSFIWDGESGSLFNVDTATFIVAKKLFKKELLNDNEKEYLKSISREENQEIERELRQLEKDNILNSKAATYQTQKKFGELKAMCLLICQDCNMRCKYCFAGDGSYHDSKSFMSSEVGKKSIDYLLSHSGNRKNLEVDFFGGEPLINFQVVKDVVSYARKKEKETGKLFHFTLTTNCLALNDDRIDYLNKEMDNIVLSIDGRKSVHDNMRKTVNGKLSHDIVMQNALKLVQKRGDKSYYVRGTFTSQNLDFANDVFYLADSGIKQISMEPVVSEIEDLKIKKEHLNRILDEYERLAYEYIERRKDNKTWFNFFHFYVDLNSGPCLQKRLTGCGAGCEYISVSTNGDVYPCHQFTSLHSSKIGSVLDNTFNMKISEDFSKNVVTNKRKCDDCFAKYYCSGGCRANNYNYNSDINIPYDMTCEMMKKRFELALFIDAVESSY